MRPGQERHRRHQLKQKGGATYDKSSTSGSSSSCMGGGNRPPLYKDLREPCRETIFIVGSFATCGVLALLRALFGEFLVVDKPRAKFLSSMVIVLAIFRVEYEEA